MTETSSSQGISTKLERIAKLAREIQDGQLYTLAHYIDVNWLRETYRRTRKDGAMGIDGQPRRNLRPRIAACNQWARIEALRRNREFLVAYRDARARWIGHDAIPFPVGTYWLRRLAHVPLGS